MGYCQVNERELKQMSVTICLPILTILWPIILNRHKHFYELEPEICPYQKDELHEG